MFQVEGERASERGGRAGAGVRRAAGGRGRAGHDLDVTGLPFASSRQVGASSLMYASHNGHLDIVKALLESRADVNAKNLVNMRGHWRDLMTIRLQMISLIMV